MGSSTDTLWRAAPAIEAGDRAGREGWEDADAMRFYVSGGPVKEQCLRNQKKSEQVSTAIRAS
ncbi:hypothetical protein Abol_013_007 [Acetobacter orleanensis JCM 7639]|nr:hypothetical protein Abol_013_007 [Acetobacter orleanensis JCM 7639]